MASRIGSDTPLARSVPPANSGASPQQRNAGPTPAKAGAPTSPSQASAVDVVGRDFEQGRVPTRTDAAGLTAARQAAPKASTQLVSQLEALARSASATVSANGEQAAFGDIDIDIADGPLLGMPSAEDGEETATQILRALGGNDEAAQQQVMQGLWGLLAANRAQQNLAGNGGLDLPPDAADSELPTLTHELTLAPDTLSPKATGELTRMFGRGLPVDINAFVQWVLRESYLDSLEDLAFYAEKVRFFNSVKKKIRAELDRVSKIQAQAKSMGLEEGDLLPGGPIAANPPDTTYIPEGAQAAAVEMLNAPAAAEDDGGVEDATEGDGNADAATDAQQLDTRDATPTEAPAYTTGVLTETGSAMASAGGTTASYNDAVAAYNAEVAAGPAPLSGEKSSSQIKAHLDAGHQYVFTWKGERYYLIKKGDHYTCCKADGTVIDKKVQIDNGHTPEGYIKIDAMPGRRDGTKLYMGTSSDGAFRVCEAENCDRSNKGSGILASAENEYAPVAAARQVMEQERIRIGIEERSTVTAMNVPPEFANWALSPSTVSHVERGLADKSEERTATRVDNFIGELKTWFGGLSSSEQRAVQEQWQQDGLPLEWRVRMGPSDNAKLLGEGISTRITMPSEEALRAQYADEPNTPAVFLFLNHMVATKAAQEIDSAISSAGRSDKKLMAFAMGTPSYNFLSQPAAVPAGSVPTTPQTPAEPAAPSEPVAATAPEASTDADDVAEDEPLVAAGDLAAEDLAKTKEVETPTGITGSIQDPGTTTSTWREGDPLRTAADLTSYREYLEQKLASTGDDAQLAQVDLQNSLQKQQQLLQMMSNISKLLHDTAMSIIRKIG